MPKSTNQKLKLLYLMRYLLERSDEEHPVTVAEMIEELARNDVAAERKSVYSDIESLRLFGLDVVQVRGRSTGYYIGQRDFELPELKLLVDSVQSSKFITHKKTLTLIKKLGKLASAYNAQLLQRQVYVRDRVKSMNESVFYNVDEVSNAITADRMIRFRYFEYAVTKERRFRRDGGFYEISPFALMWDDENYYMLGWDAETSILKHYRVDKMTDISATDKPREGKAAFADVDVPSYSRKVFCMFAGSEQTVRLRFANHLIGVVIDRFGGDITVVSSGPEHFTVNLDVVVSPQFYAWLFGFGTEVEIVSPEGVRANMKALAEQVAGLY